MLPARATAALNRLDIRARGGDFFFAESGPGLQVIGLRGAGRRPRLGDFFGPRAVFQLREIRARLVELRHQLVGLETNQHLTRF